MALATPFAGTDRLSGLDVLRGLAILLVVIGHYLPKLGGPLFDLLITCGGGGVILFFYLSGFLIFRNVQSQPAGIFLSRRLCKLLPAYWVNILSILAVSAVWGGTAAADPRSVLSNLFLVQEFTHADLLNGVYWSLQVEVKFYLLILLFHRLFGIGRIYYLLAALVLGELLTFALTRHGSVQLTYLIVFFPGIAAARTWQSNWQKRGWLELGMVTAVTAAILLAFLNANNLYHCVHGLIFAPLLVLALRRQWTQPVLRFLGRISYSYYMYHASVGYLLLAPFEPFASPWIGAAVIAAAALSTAALSTLSFHLIEQPGVAWGRRLEEAWRRRFRPDGLAAAEQPAE